MFSHPLNSFQDTLAQAKEEREQLDRLLRISTPRERFLLASIALLVFFLAVWVLFGQVTRTAVVNGILVQPDESRFEGALFVSALIWNDAGLQANTMPGLPATVELIRANGAVETFAGRIADVSPVSLTEEFAALESAVAVSASRFVIELDAAPSTAPVAGIQCRVVIELDSHSALELLRMRPA